MIINKLTILIMPLLIKLGVAKGGHGGFHGGRGFSSARSSGHHSSGSFHARGTTYYGYSHYYYGGSVTHYDSGSLTSSPGFSTTTFKEKAFITSLSPTNGTLTFANNHALIKDENVPFDVGNTTYYWVNNSNTEGNIKCLMPYDKLNNNYVAYNSIQNSNSLFALLMFKNTSKPNAVYWNCKNNTESCCGMECCPNNLHEVEDGAIFSAFVLIFLLAFLSCCLYDSCIIHYRNCQSVRKNEQTNKSLVETNFPPQIPQNQPNYPLPANNA